MSGAGSAALRAAALGLTLALTPGLLGAIELPQRRHISIVGSSTLFPIVSALAERFSHLDGRRAPVLEATGTGGGFKRFCAGLGLDTPDVVMASRPMKTTEWESCRAQGVDDVGVVRLGYDGIAVVNARSGPRLALSTNDLYLALARLVPDPVGRARLVPNPYRNWRELDAALPDLPIRVLGPPPTSGTRDTFVERVLEKTCDAARGAFAGADSADCRALREDGVYEAAGENDARLVRRLQDDPGAVGILGFNFLERNRDRVKAARIDGMAPAPANIAAGIYPLARPLLLYYKTPHTQTVPGLTDFLQHIASPEASGADGYLVGEGLIPLSPGERPVGTEHVR
ncbi:MAG: substrate-binding domain-containing protein [Gammaproteobacteria bacterium]